MRGETDSGDARRPRGPGLVYSVLAVSMAVIVGVVALTATQPPPPTIAEFAPQAVEQIEEAPSEQTSDFGSGDGGAPGGEGASLPTPPPQRQEQEVIEVARVRRCVGDPPRQVEDPQSPPCVPYWDGDNGGATYRGVTRDEIRVAFPNYQGGEEAEVDQFARAIETFFNKRFEFYGRKIRLLPLTTSGEDPPGARADAEAAAAMEIFGSTGYTQRINIDTVYYEELARRNILAAGYFPTPHSQEALYGRLDPYLYNRLPAMDEMQAQIADWACRGLAGRDARFAGDAVTRGQERTFGLAWTASDGIEPDTSLLERRLEGCGSPVALKRMAPESSSADDQATYQNISIRMREAGVTTIICLCHLSTTGFLMRGATSQGYFPEWYLSSFYQQDEDGAIRVFMGNTGQEESIFGMTSENRLLPADEQPWGWAAKEIDPGIDVNNSHSADQHRVYRNLLLLASGIQMAGPDLTPQTFRDALFRTTFPNPGAGGPPYYQAHVSFGPHHTFNDDGAIFWWGPRDRSHEGLAGTVCYLNNGTRYRAGEYPATDDGLFGPGCLDR